MSEYADALGAEPAAIVRPDTPDAVADAIRQAGQTGGAVIPWGGGTGQTYGYLPARVDTLLDMRGLNRIIAHEPGDLTVTVEAGTTLDSVQDVLAQHNQFLPLDPPHAHRATIGGIIATNADGPSRAGYGRVRDWLIGLTVVDGEGRLVKGGGKVVKNVTGYDLPKLHAGALGTLGVIVEATFKVAPRPDASRIALFTPPPDADALAAFLERLHFETAPAMSVVRTEGLGLVVALLYSGVDEVVEGAIACAHSLAAHAGAVALALLPGGMAHPFDAAPPPDSPLVFRFAGNLARAAARHAALARMGFWGRIDTHPATGHTEAAYMAGPILASVLPVVMAWAESEGVAVAVLHAPLDLRRAPAATPLWWPLPPALPLMRGIKDALDPHRILNPGRFVGGL